MSLAMKYAMKKRMAKGGMASGAEMCEMCKGGTCTKHMADGGDVDEASTAPQGPVTDPEVAKKMEQSMRDAFHYAHGAMVDRIMRKHYSEGGEVANDTPVTADLEDNEFDDLVKDDDLEFNETGKNSGDEDGDAAEDEDRKDMVGDIMKSRKKKDKLPRAA